MKKLEGYSLTVLHFLIFWTHLGNVYKIIYVFFLRQRGLSGKANAGDGARRVKVRDRVGRAVPAPEANAEIQANLDVCDILMLFHLSIIIDHLFFSKIRNPSSCWDITFAHQFTNSPHVQGPIVCEILHVYILSISALRFHLAMCQLFDTPMIYMKDP